MRRTIGAMRILASILLIGGILTGGFFFLRYANGAPADCHNRFHFLNARRRCEKDEPPKKQEYDIFADTLLWRIDAWKKSGEVSHVTVYFRDLENGPTFGIDEKEHFAPASLLKVPIMIALLKYAETHPEILDETVKAEEAVTVGQNVFDPEKTVVPDHAYTIREVLRRMIVYSDNGSKELLRRYLESVSPGILDQTFIDLGISLQNPDGSQFLTVKTYASLFRALFNASYLNREMSEEALQLLSETEFSKGIVAGVPEGTEVAHKFGYLDVHRDEHQLHDCGIVYHPHMPYLLCIMTRGKNVETVTDIIAKISQRVFEEVSVREGAQ